MEKAWTLITTEYIGELPKYKNKGEKNMRKIYEQAEMEILYFESSDVMDVSAPTGSNFDGTIEDCYGDQL